MFTGSAFGLVAGVLFTLLLAYACRSDLRTRRIPNKLVLVLGVTGLAYSVSFGTIPHGLLRGVEGLAMGLALWLPFWLLGWLGAGDVKLFAGAAAWLGPWGAVEAAVVGALLGGLFTIVWLGWQRGVRVAVEKSLIAMIHPRVLASPSVTTDDRRRLVPYGIALALALAVTGWFPSLVSLDQVLR